MKVALNGCGRVGRALLEHWLTRSDAPQVILLRNSTGQWRDDKGIPKSELEAYIRKPHPLPMPLQSPGELLQTCPVDLWFELTPTRLEEAPQIHRELIFLLSQGIDLVFANKAPLLQDYQALKKVADASGCFLGLSGVLGASFPSYALLHYGCLGANILHMEGILNGTTNFILQKMEEGFSFESALQLAQELGIAETDPSYDIDGLDSAIKMSLLASVASNQNVRFSSDAVTGIRHIGVQQVQNLKAQGKKIKLVALYHQGRVTVEPKVFSKEDLFYHVNHAEKALTLTTDSLSDMTLIGGKSGLKEVAAALHRDLLWIKEQRSSNNCKIY